MKGRFVEEIYEEDETEDALRSTRSVGLVVVVTIICLLTGVAIAILLASS